MNVLLNTLVPLILIASGPAEDPDRDEATRVIERLTEAIERNPGDAAAYFKRAAAYRFVGELDKALADYGSVIERDPMRAEAYVGWAVVARQRGCFLQERIVMLRKAIELQPEHAVAHRELGAAFIDSGQVVEAIAALRTAAKLQPDDPRTYYLLGISLYHQCAGDEAATVFRKAIELDPKYAPAHNNLGNVLKAQGKLEEAIACYRQAIEIDPKYAAAHTNLGVAFAVQNKLDQAIACFRKAIEIDPNYPTAHYNLGLVLSQLDRLMEARDAISRAIELSPGLAEAYRARAKVHARLGDQDKAAADEEKAKQLGGPTIPLRGFGPSGPGRLNPDLAEAYYNLGSVLSKQGRHTRALVAFSRAIEVNPNLAKAYRARAKVHAQLGNRDQANADEAKGKQLADDESKDK